MSSKNTNKIQGSNNNDTLTGTSGADEMDGKKGNDTMSGAGGRDVLYGDKGNDQLSGGADADLLDGDDGNDDLTGDAGNDYLAGGEGHDSLSGGTGNDVLFGDAAIGNNSAGNGKAWADIENDAKKSAWSEWIKADKDADEDEAGNDTLNGGDGDDLLVGGYGNDVLLGGAGDDVLYGATYSTKKKDSDKDDDDDDDDDDKDDKNKKDKDDKDKKDKDDDDDDDAADNDVLNAGAGSDRIHAGDGNDTVTHDVTENTGASDVYSGGSGKDTLQLVMTRAQWMEPAFQTDLRNYLQFLAAHKNSKGVADNASFKFTSFGLEVSAFESLKITVDGVAVNPADEAVLARNDRASTDEDTAVSGNVLVDNGSGADAVPDFLRTVSLLSAPASGTVILQANGDYTYTPGATLNSLAVNETATDSFTYQVEDADGDTTSATVTLTITGRNDTPVATADTGSTGEDSTLTIDVLANDSDVDTSDKLSVTSASVASGTATVTVVDNKLQVTPGSTYNTLAAGETATVVVNYAIADGNGGTADSTLTVTVNGTNDAPVATADTASTHEDDALTIDVLANDSDVDTSDTLSISSAAVASGTATVTVVDNKLHVTPDSAYNALAAGETATVVVNYAIADGKGGTADSTVTVTVNGTNDAPTATFDTVNVAPGAEISLDLLANDSDPDGDSLRITQMGASGLGTVTLNADGNSALFVAGGAAGVEELSYTISDGNGGTSTNKLLVVVAPGAGGQTLALGSAGADVLDNSNATDDLTILGGLGNDTITGGSGDDQIFWSAGDGNDVVEGGAGWDHMFIDLGGPGSGAAEDVLEDGGPIGEAVDNVPEDYETPSEPPTPTPGPVEDVTTFASPPPDTEDDGLPPPEFSDETDRPVDAELDVVDPTLLALPDAPEPEPLSTEFDGPEENEGPVEPVPDPLELDDFLPGPDAATLTAVDGRILLSAPGVALSLDGIEDVSIRLGDDIADLLIGDLTGTDIAQDTVTVTGNDGPNKLFAQLLVNSRAVVQGLGGDDILIGSAGDDDLHGGEGNDILDGGQRDDRLYGGPGNDTAGYLSAPLGVTVNLGVAGAQNTVGAGTDLLSDIENLIGSNRNDILTGSSVANTIEGRSGDDYIDGGAGSDVLDGGPGNDRLFGSAGDDTLRGAAGNDQLSGASGNDLLEAGDGNDVLDGGSGNDVFNGGSGFDYASFESASTGVTVTMADIFSGRLRSPFGFRPPIAQPTGDGMDKINRDIEGLIGSKFNDVLTGSSSADTLKGGNGNDQLNGGNGNDTLDGGEGDDGLNGGDGVDTVSYASATAGIWADLADVDGFDTKSAGIDTYTAIENVQGSSFNDRIWGSAQNNTLNGGNGDDILDGRDGNDVLYGGEGRDRLIGNLGDDDLSGGNSNDLLEGREGNDRLFGGNGNDNLLGGDGNDMLDGGSGNDILDGGAGRDIANYVNVSSYVWVNLSLTGPQDTKTAGLDTLSNIEDVAGSKFNDRIWGNSGNNQLLGMDGNDKIDGGDGNDIIDGGNGNDQLWGGAGDDVFLASNGSDIMRGGAGIDTVDYSRLKTGVRVNLGATNQRPFTDSLYEIENVIGSNNPNNVFQQDFLVGSEADNVIYGLGGYDRINGMGGNDRLYGGSGDDQVRGGDGDDVLDGGSGIDFLYGDAGNDTLYARDGRDWLEGGDGNDTFIVSDENTENYDQQLYGGNGSDTVDYSNSGLRLSADLRSAYITRHIDIPGYPDLDVFVRDDISGLEHLKGSTGNDAIGGTTGNNMLYGNAGDDSLNGNGGYDLLDGGTGNDVLTLDYSASAGGDYRGGSGTDRVVINLSAADLGNQALLADLAAFGKRLFQSDGSEQTQDFTFGAQTLKFNGLEQLTVNVDGTPNVAPTFSSASSLSVNENLSAAGTLALTDSQSPLKQFLIEGGPDAARFTLNAQTGALQFVAAPDFEAPADADGNNVYQLTVLGGDGLGGWVRQAISVSVQNLNDVGVPNVAPTLRFVGPNLLSNGSFEQPAIGGAFLTNQTGGLTGWTIASGDFDIIRSLWPASEGAQSLDLNGSGPGSITQSFATTAGMRYRVTLDLSKNSGEGSTSATISISADGQSQSQTFSGASTSSNMLWDTRSVSFVADNGNATLAIASLSPTASGPALDNVRVWAEGVATRAGTPVLVQGLQVADADAGSAPLTLSLNVAHGALSLGNTANLVVVDGNGNDGSLVVSGSQAALAAVLSNALTYAPAAGFVGTDTLIVNVNDNGNTGTGGPASATLNVPLVVERASVTHQIGNLVSNGSFEQPAFGTDITVIGAGSGQLSGWTIASGSVDVIRSGFWQAAAGTQSLDLNGESPASLQQALATAAGKQYTVLFAQSKNTNPGIASEASVVQVSADGSGGNFSFNQPVTGTDMKWTQQRLDFTATDASTLLGFTSVAPGGASGPALDNVVVVERQTFADFRAGAGGDVLNFSALLDSLQAPRGGTAAFDGGWLDFDISSGVDTVIRLDTTGGGDNYVDFITLTGVLLQENASANVVI